MTVNTIEVPLALQQLIVKNNEVLRATQIKLLREIEDANSQMMAILKLDPDTGWRLDMERMVYTKVDLPVEETSTEA